MVLGSIELIFFIEACVVLCSGFLVNTVVRIHWCFSCYRVKERLGVCKELGGWIDEKDAPSCMASHSATKKEEGTRAAMTFVLPRYHCTCWSLTSGCTPACWWEVANGFLLFYYLYSNPQVLPLLPVPHWKSEWAAAWCWAASRIEPQLPVFQTWSSLICDLGVFQY